VFELARLKHLASSIDPKAFVVINETAVDWTMAAAACLFLWPGLHY
jgi:uncharacterized membrane-anchored protein YitT (DUF2179 family)